MQGRAQPRQGHAVRLVAEPVHGLRPPLHVLLRPRLRAARRPAGGRALRHLDPGQGERRRGAAARARASVLARRGRRDRRGHRSLPAVRRPLPADARLPRGARRRGEPVRADHAGAADRPRPRRARRGRPPRRGLGHVLGADARRGGLAEDRARDGAAAPAAACARAARRGRHPHLGRDGADPARHLRLTGAARRRSCAPRARPAPAGSGPACST